MPDAKGKTPITRPDVQTEADESGDTFESVSFLEDANALLEKIKTTAENVTTCQVCVFSNSQRGIFWGTHVASPGDEIAYYCNTVRY